MAIPADVIRIKAPFTGLPSAETLIVTVTASLELISMLFVKVVWLANTADVQNKALANMKHFFIVDG
jgi:hypothetical protein